MSHDEPFLPADEPTPEQEAWVARMLSGADPVATGAAVPDHVTARLDETLAALVNERAAQAATQAATQPAVARPARVVPLRRRAAQGLLVAAAVTVGGFALPHVVQSGGDAGSADSAGVGAESAPDDFDGLDSGLLGGAEKDGATDLNEPQPLSAPAAAQSRLARRVDRLTTARFDEQVERLAAVVSGERSRYAAGQQPGCAVPPVREGGRWWVVRLDGALAALVLEPAQQSGQTDDAGGLVATAYACRAAQAGEVLATTRLR